jgi:cell division transport system ATP-binding protein
MALVRFSNVGLRYSTGPEILKDVSFELSAGAFYFLTGPSGAGKTSLLKLLYLGQKPTRGIVNMFGRDLSVLPRKKMPEIRRQIGRRLPGFPSSGSSLFLRQRRPAAPHRRRRGKASA